MDHRQAEALILEEAELQPSQQGALSEHLANCAACRQFAAGWQEVERLLGRLTLDAPRPGFTARWRARMEAQRRAAQQRQLSLLIALLSLGTSMLFVPLLLQFFVILLAGNDLAVDALKGALEWFGWISFLLQVILQASESLARAVPVAWWVALVSGLGALGGLWLWLLGRWAPSLQREGMA
jgi:anti-sigma factor RsiW